MAEVDESIAVGAEKSPKKVGAFVLALLIAVVVVLGIMLLFLHHAGGAPGQ